MTRIIEVWSVHVCNIIQIRLPVDSKSTDLLFEPCLGHFRIRFEWRHQVL